MREYLRDARRYLAHSVPLKRELLASLPTSRLEAQVTKDYHRIEKGLALPEPKRPFGSDPRARLALALSNPHLRAASSPKFREHAESALSALDLYNETGVISDEVSPRGPDLTRTEDEIASLVALFEERRSIRNFTTEPVALDKVREAVRLAGTAPSVCNRQSSRAHYLSDRDTMDRALSLQGGNRGFGQTVQGLFVVTSDLNSFGGSGERNQGWVDGGLFAMSLVLALHGQGVGTCMLNWSKSNSVSAKLREVVDIPENENVVALIAIGHPPEGYRVARSPRRDLSEILRLKGAE